MALPAGRYGVTKNQLLKIKKLPMNTIKLIEELTEKFDLLGTAAFKNSTSVVTESSDLVESGAVYDALGFGNKNLWKFGSFTGAYSNVPFSLPAGTYTFSFSSSSPVGIRLFYNENDSVVVSGESSFNIVLEQPVVKINYSCNDSIATNVQLEKGSTATAYEPYHASVSDSLAEKCDNSVIAPVENGSTASQAYAVGEHFIRDGKFCTCIVPVTTASTWSDGYYVEGTIADNLVKKATFNLTTNVAGVANLCSNDRIVVAVKSAGHIIESYITSAGDMINIRSTNIVGEAEANTNITGTYYYI